MWLRGIGMFGLSAADRLRLDNAAQGAVTALTRLEAHEQRCTERYVEIRDALAAQKYQSDTAAKERRAAMNKLFFAVISIAVMVLGTIVKDLINRGLAN